MSGIHLVRHPPVAAAWAGRCYGQSDMGWSRDGQRMAVRLLDELAALRPDMIVHSGLKRTRSLADRLGRRLSLVAIGDARWRERAFGRWEGRRWDAIWRETGDAMDGMVGDPASYRPGGGETTDELAARVGAALRALPADRTVVVVTHGGPIAAVRATAARMPARALPALIPACGQVVRVDLPGGANAAMA